MSEQTAPKTPLLDAIIRVMEIVVRESKAFRMYDFYENRKKIVPETTVHNCGTAACICGYAALDMDVRMLTKQSDCGNLTDDVWESVKNELDNFYVSYSMFDAYPEGRMRAAQKCKWITHLLEHPHLIRETPTAAEALDYLIKVRVAFNEVKHG